MIELKNGTGLGFEEVVDTLSDALEVTEKVHAAVQDGIGLSDLPTIFTVTPLLNEIIRDRETFAAQFRDIDDDESQRVAGELIAKHGGSADTIVQKALEAVDLASDWHVAIDQNVALVQRTITFGRDLFATRKIDTPQP